MRIKWLRHTFQVLFLAGTGWAAWGVSTRGFEAYCPFGGAEALYAIFTGGTFTCALGATNLALFVAMLGLTVVSKKSLCGWVCPIGALSEWGAALTAKLWPQRPEIPARADRYLVLLRYVVLAVVLFFTYKTGELIFRGYDPFYMLFSGMGHGADSTISWIFAGIFVVGVVILPMSFCRYLCPLGAVMDPLSRFGLVKIGCNLDACTQCGMCAPVCPQRLDPSSVAVLRHRDCTNCLDCIEECPEEGALGLRM